MSPVTIIHTIIHDAPEVGPSVFAKHEDAPGAIFCFNNIHADPNRPGHLTSDISVLAEEGTVLAPEIEARIETLIDPTFVEAIRIISEEPAQG